MTDPTQFPVNLDSFRDVVQVLAKESTVGPEGGRKEQLVARSQLRCSVQPIVGDARRATPSGAIAPDAAFRAVFPADPREGGLVTDGVLRHSRRGGAPLKYPPSYAVLAITPDGGAGLTWTAYLKFTGP